MKNRFEIAQTLVTAPIVDKKEERKKKLEEKRKKKEAEARAEE